MAEPKEQPEPDQGELNALAYRGPRTQTKLQRWYRDRYPDAFANPKLPPDDMPPVEPEASSRVQDIYLPPVTAQETRDGQRKALRAMEKKR